ncbi:MAG: HNH endonuclease signature motif containing protein [Thiobacillaceae bacterium]
MDERIKKIRELLDEVAFDLNVDEGRQFAHNFDALELPGIVSSVICFLQPLLLPNEAAIYWHMFDRSILQTGQQFCRVSTRGLTTGVIKSASGQSESLAYSTVQGALKALEEKGMIVGAGDTNREGTLYRVLLPEEIPTCVSAIRASVPEPPKSAPDVKKEADFYNVAENRLRIFERDGYKCHYCHKQLTRFSATLDHLQPVSEGGDNSFDNLATACLHCNSRRGARPVMDALTRVSDNDQSDN